MDDNQNRRQTNWKTTKIEDDQIGRRPKWKKTKMEDDKMEDDQINAKRIVMQCGVVGFRVMLCDFV